MLYIVVDPSSYCLKKLDGLATFEEAINRCADYETGWRLPVIMDRQMIERMIWDAWISAKGTSELPWLYKTLEDDYLPYAGWNSNQPSLTADPCVCISNHAMSTYRCTSPLSVVCYTETADICSGSPNIVHGTKTVNDTHVVYVCDEGYFMSSLNVTDVTIKCDCEGSTRLQDIDNCTAIECALPQSNSFGTVINMTGLEVNNQVLYRCPDGQQIPATKSRYYTLTCTQVRGTTTAVWSAPPLCQVMRCEGMPDVINGRFSMTDNSFGSVIEFVCNAWYWIPEMGNNRVNITCTLDDSGLFVSWCWTPPCEEIICPEPPHIPMASYVRESNKAVYTCEPNYRIKGALSNKTEVVCQYDDNFTTTWVHLPTCEVITCSDVPEVEDATIVLPAADNCSDSVVTYQCNNGYIIYQDGRPIYSDNKTFNKTCQTDYSTFTGKWTGNYSCEILRCDLPQELPNSHLTDASRQVGGTANYSCNDNYAVTSTGKRWTSSVCLFEDDDQLPHWTSADNCSLIHCKEADNISNAVMINSSTNIGDVTVYRCLTGYRVKRAESANKEFVIYCQLDDSQSSASWTEAAGCEAVMCSAPPSVLNSQVTVSGHKVGDKARYVCNSSGSNQSWESTCVLDDVNQTMAVWKPIEKCTAISDDDLVTTTSAMSITRDLDTTTSISVTSRDGPLIRQCSNPDTVSGAVVKYRDLFINSRVMYVALPGYVFPNGGKSRSFVCLSGADWSTEARDLKRKRCSKLPEVTGAIKSTEENYVGTEVKIQCINSEAKMENGLSVLWTRCTYSEQWTFIPGKCDTQRCGPFEVVNNSRLIAYNNSVGGVSVIKCNLSYRFADGDQTKSFRCLSSLEWQQREPCYLAVCPRLRVPVNGAISTEKAMEGVLVEVTCKPGFMFPDKSTKRIITCNSTFNWNDTTDDCQIIRCRELPELMNGNMTSSDTLYNSSVTYICDVGYRLEYGYRQMTVRCDENAEWTLDPLTCKSDRCPPVPEVDNAVASTHEALNGTIVIYTCYKGHLLPNNDSHFYISCNGSDWNITQTSCSKVTCPQLMLTHAILFGNGTTFGDLVNFTCDEGYIYGNKTDGVLKCEADAQWNGVTTGCMPIDCGVPPTVKYSVHSVPSSHKYGTTITYTCVSGFWFKRAITRQSVTCTRNGQWSDIIRNCTLITCPPIPVWDDMEWNSTDNSVGASVNVSCTRDERKHFTISVCTANGEWKPALDNCKTERIVFEPETEEAQGAEGVGIVVGSVIAVLYILMAISDAPIIFEAIKGSKTKMNK